MDTSNCLKRYITSFDDNKKPYKNIANYGLAPTETAKVCRNGEYFGVEIQAIDHIAPLFTTDNIQKAYNLLVNEKIQEVINLLKIEKEYQKFGDDVIHYIIYKWCEHVHVPIPKNINNATINDKNLDIRIRSNRSESINGKFKIIGIGKNSNTGESVLPEEWIDKVFESGDSFHTEMNKLSHRKGKPPVTYCCIYGMTITTNNDITQWEIIDIKILKKYNLLVVIHKTNYGCKSELVTSNKENIKNILSSGKKYEVIYLPKSFLYMNTIFIIENGIFIKSQKKKNNDNTSYLSSLLQKCFRNEYMCSLLDETITKLHFSPGYNLPDHHFAKVSGVRQLCWRSYISLIEDVSGYSTSNNKDIDLLDLFVLSNISNIDPNVILSNCVLAQLKKSMLKAQKIKSIWEWWKYNDVFKDVPYNEIFKKIKFKNDSCSRIKNSLILALTIMPMMRNDFTMLSRCYDMVEQTNNVTNLPDNLYLEYECNEFDDLETKMRALDMHCFPSILIQLQGSLSFIPTKYEMLQDLAHFIWNNSSKFNTRIKYAYNFPTKNGIKILKSLLDIQYISIIKPQFNCSFDWITNNWNPVLKHANTNKSNNITIDSYTKRLAFLLLFGKKYKIIKKIKNKQYDAIIAGSSEKPCKIKRAINKNKIEYIGGQERYLAEKELVIQFQNEKNIIDTKLITPPAGYKWKISGKSHITIKITDYDSQQCGGINNLTFFVDDTKLTPFDGSELLAPIERYESSEMPDDFKENLDIAFYNENGEIFETLLLLFEVSRIRYERGDFRIFEWEKLMSNIPKKVILYTRSRILMSTTEIIIGPIDRRGQKTQNSVSYQYEGVIWRLIIAFSALYPNVIKICSPYKFSLNKSLYGYTHLMEILNRLSINENTFTYSKNKNIPVITTKLWDHQKKSVSKIIDGLAIDKRRGFGDASDVGSGKTLTALSIIVELLKYCSYNNVTIPNKGFLIMVPSENLYDTWRTEIKKHTKGFHLLEQLSNGKFDNNDKIESYTIVITTMGRCRDHPIIHPWLLVVVDECLTVQNKEALQTEEAWRQSTYSYFGVILLSATFFRSRFEKMLYMLSMLNTQLPITSDYLDTILSESIICNLNQNERKWITNTHYSELSKKHRNEYDKLASKHIEIGFEKTYYLLIKFIKNNINYVNIFKRAIDNILISRQKAKILIYASSKDEANNIANMIDNVGRYPKKDIHTVVSYAEGTFGLNDLIQYDTILTRPPDPDKLPQMKGRLDRPGQSNNVLNIEYVLIKNTIEDAGLYKLEIARNFYKQHIMPLAEFYKIAVLNK